MLTGQESFAQEHRPDVLQVIKTQFEADQAAAYKRNIANPWEVTRRFLDLWTVYYNDHSLINIAFGHRSGLRLQSRFEPAIVAAEAELYQLGRQNLIEMCLYFASVFSASRIAGSSDGRTYRNEGYPDAKVELLMDIGGLPHVDKELPEQMARIMRAQMLMGVVMYGERHYNPFFWDALNIYKRIGTHYRGGIGKIIKEFDSRQSPVGIRTFYRELQKRGTKTLAAWAPYEADLLLRTVAIHRPQQFVNPLEMMVFLAMTGNEELMHAERVARRALHVDICDTDLSLMGAILVGTIRPPVGWRDHPRLRGIWNEY